MNKTMHDSKTKFLDAALQVVRAKGYAATRIDDVCAEAGLTKGSFFHHFEGKEDLALAAAAHWDAVTSAAFVAAPYRSLPDPVDRLLGYVDFRKAILTGKVADYTCFVGTMVQDVYETHPVLRAACERSMNDHIATVAADIADAIRARGIATEWTAESLARHTHAVIQGGFVLAKATRSNAAAIEAFDHLRRYLALVFFHPGRKE